MIILLSIIGLIFTHPVKNTSSNEDPDNVSSDQVFQQAEQILKHYSHLIKSDTDHLVYGILRILMDSPASFMVLPRHTIDIIFKNLGEKLDDDKIDILIKPILLALEQNYQSHSEQASKLQLTDDVKEKIEDALDNFFDDKTPNPSVWITKYQTGKQSENEL